MTAGVMLRIVAVMIAVTGLIDPVVTWTLPVARPVTIVTLEDPARHRAVDRDGPGSVARNLEGVLSAEYDVHLATTKIPETGSACPAGGGCILISDGTVPDRVTAGAEVIGAVRVFRDAHGVSISRVSTPPSTSVHAVAALEVELQHTAVSGTTLVEVFDGDALVGSATLEWVPPGPDNARVAVEWVPVGAGLRRLRVVASGAGGESATADVGIVVRDEPVAVLMHEPEATWLGTFVRRALAADPRLRLDARTRLAPGLVAASTAATALTRAELEDVSAVIVAAPSLLSAAEVELLERFARTRGGSVLLALDRQPSGPITRLMPAIAAERRDTEPVAIGPLRATEYLTFDAAADGVTVLEASDAGAVIVSRALGKGRVIVSGALDAWRFREGAVPFGPYWSRMVAAAAVAAGPPLGIAVSNPIVAPGEVANLTVEMRTLDEVGDEFAAAAELLCADGETIPIRLWPAAQPGMFTARVQPVAEGRCTIRAIASAPLTLAAQAELLVAADASVRPRKLRRLESAMAAHGGRVFEVHEAAAVVAAVRQRLPVTTAPAPVRPMRSPWWIVPFAICLSGEWWLRRRRGLR